MSENFGLAGIWDDLKRSLIVDVNTYEDSSSALNLRLVTEFTVRNGADKSDSGLEIYFEEVILTVGVPPDLHVEKHKGLASGESFKYEHRSRYSDLGKIVFTVDGTVSPSHLFRVKHKASNIPPGVASLSIASYVEVLKDINIHRWLRDVIEIMPIPASNTTQAEIEAQKDRLRDAAKEISGTKEQLQNIYGFIIRKTDTDRDKMNKHRKLVEDYLDHTAQGCSELRKMLDTYNARTLESNRQGIVGRLSQESLKLDQATEGLS
jgi:hypothetical protein